MSQVKTVKVSEKGQIAIPTGIRESMNIHKGDELIMIQEKDKILLEKPSAMLKKEFAHLLKHSEKAAKKLWENEEDEIWNNL